MLVWWREALFGGRKRRLRWWTSVYYSLFSEVRDWKPCFSRHKGKLRQRKDGPLRPSCTLESSLTIRYGYCVSPQYQYQSQVNVSRWGVRGSARCHHGNACQSFCWKSGGAGLKDRLHPHSRPALIPRTPFPSPQIWEFLGEVLLDNSSSFLFHCRLKAVLDQVLAVSVWGLLPGSGPRYSKAQGIM